jgi:thioredoxin-like negative regulator of GroEL
MEKEFKVKKIFLSNFKTQVLESEKPWLIKFTSETCYLCVGLRPVFDQLALAFREKVNFGNINIQVEKKLAQLFIKDGVPTICYFRGGKGDELHWPEKPNPDSGYSFEQLAGYIAGRLENE